MASNANRPLPRSYAHVPRTILWLVPGGEIRVGGRMEQVEPFYLSKWPITNEQFEAFDPGHRRAPTSPGNRDLAVGVSFQHADAYCRWYADVARKPMRLPTETEWLYACRGAAALGEPSSWDSTPDAIDQCCWHAGNSDGRLQHPEQRAANDFGLHGMLGSVWEWVAPADEGEPQRTLCGGSFRLHAAELQCGLTKRQAPDSSADDTGFRVARSFRIRR